LNSSGGVLEANAMIGHDVYFDVGNLRIGWAESTCNYTKLVTDHTGGNGPSPSSGDAPSQSRSNAPSQSRSNAPSQSHNNAPSQSHSNAPSQSHSNAPSQSRGPEENRTGHASEGQSDAGGKSPFSGSHRRRHPPIEFFSWFMFLAIVAQ
jgi:hypothetical protein